MSPRSDTELLADHVKGSSSAFAEIVERHQDRLWAVAVGIVSDPHDAADVVQDAMVKAFRRADGFRGDAAVGTWLHRIVVTTALDLLRARGRAPRPSDELPEQPDPRDMAATASTRADVQAALATLSDDHRAAVVLVDMVGMPVADAADVLGVAPGTVKSRCFRARARLAALLRTNDSTDDGAGAGGASVDRRPAPTGNRAGRPDVETTGPEPGTVRPPQEAT